MNEPSKYQPEYNDKRRTLNKSYLVEPIIRNRIKDSIFYKQYLYLTNEQTILPVIVNQVKYIGGLDANNRPSPFLCCFLRLLEINPSNDIIKLYLSRFEFKYLVCLTLMVIRMTKKSVDIYTIYDNYLTNYSKLRYLLPSPEFVNGIPVNYGVTFMDQFIDDLLKKDRVVGLILPRLDRRTKLVENGLISERVYHVTSLDQEEEEEAEEEFVSDSD